MKPGGSHAPEARSRISAATKRAMDNPAVRQRISERTKEGMRKKASGVAAEVARLRDAWARTCPEARETWLREILAPLCKAAVPPSPDEPL